MSGEEQLQREVTRMQKRVARFKVFAQLGGAGGAQHGTVEIDRDSGMMSVRVKRKRRRYSMPLGYVASMMVKAIIMYEIQEKRKANELERCEPHGPVALALAAMLRARDEATWNEAVEACARACDCQFTPRGCSMSIRALERGDYKPEAKR